MGKAPKEYYSIADFVLGSMRTSQPDVEAKCGCKHEDRFDCEYMDENKNCAINKKG